MAAAALDHLTAAAGRALLQAATSDAASAPAPAVAAATGGVGAPPPPPLFLSSYSISYTGAALAWGLCVNTVVGVTALLVFGYLRVTSVYSSKLFRPRQLLMVRARGAPAARAARQRRGPRRQARAVRAAGGLRARHRSAAW